MEKFAVCDFVSTYLTKHNTLCFKRDGKTRNDTYPGTYVHSSIHFTTVPLSQSREYPPVVSVGKMRNKIYKYDADKYSILNF